MNYELKPIDIVPTQSIALHNPEYCTLILSVYGQLDLI